MQAKINIITPVYNGAHLIHRLLDSVLIQTYSNISMYVIDDGSTDSTKSVIKKYIPLFNSRGYELHYIYQENSGQSAALNNGLKYVDGDFLLWPDADDWYKTNNAIEIMAQVIQHMGDDVGIVRCQIEYIAEDMKWLKRTAFAPCNTPSDLLEEAIYQNNGFVYAPIEWIIKVKYLDDFIPNREIFVNKYAGQNAQILLPYLCYSKCVTINKILACYLVRDTSHSHSMRPYELSMAYDQAILDTFVETLSQLKGIDEEKRAEYINARRKFYYEHFFNYDYDFDRTNEFRKHYREAIQYGLPIGKRLRRLWYWTYIFNIKMYKQLAIFIHRIKKVCYI